MKPTTEELNNIKQLITNDNDVNVKLGIRIAIKTFNMSKDELIDLIDIEDIITDQYLVLGTRYYIHAFGRTWESSIKEYTLTYYYSNRDWLHSQIIKYLNE